MKTARRIRRCAAGLILALAVSSSTACDLVNAVVTASAEPPTAEAGPSVTVAPHTEVILDGSGSTSASGRPLGYTWYTMDTPEDTQAYLYGSRTARLSFTPDVPGTYRFSLVVSDGISDSRPDPVSVICDPDLPAD